jgi:hypothetical protein
MDTSFSVAVNDEVLSRCRFHRVSPPCSTSTPRLLGTAPHVGVPDVETIRLDSDLHRVVVGHDVDLTDGAHVVEREGARIGNGGVVVDGHLVPGGRDGDVPQCVVLGQADALGRNANSPPRSVVPSGRVIDGAPVILPTTTISRAAALTAPASSDAVVTVVGGSAIVQF